MHNPIAIRFWCGEQVTLPVSQIARIFHGGSKAEPVLHIYEVSDPAEVAFYLSGDMAKEAARAIEQAFVIFDGGGAS